MRTFAQIQQELTAWRRAISAHDQAAAELKARADKLAPNNGLKLWNSDEHAELLRKAKREMDKSAAAKVEIARLMEEGNSLSNHVRELKRNLHGYERQLQFGGIDWSRVDSNVNPDEYLAEIAGKAERLRKEIEAYA